MTTPALTQVDLLAVVDRALDEAYVQALREGHGGYELIQAHAKVGERCSTAVKRFEDDVYILTSRAGVLATVVATFYRTSDAAGAGSMLAGTVVRASRGGQAFRTTEDAVFGPTDLEATATAVALGRGYEWNIRGPFLDPQGNTWPGELDTIDLPMMAPVFFDPSILVRNDADADGLGRPATLDVLGAERSLLRQPGEGDAGYRVRIRTLPDTVSPAAIRRQLANYFRAFPSIQYSSIETWQHEYQECYDAPDVPGTLAENFDANLFVYDDPRSPTPTRNRWLGMVDYLGAFVVDLTPPPPMDDFGFAYDDPAGDEVGTPVAAATRAISAYDLIDPLSGTTRSPSYDGRDVGVEAFLRNLLALLDDIKAGGVYAVVIIQGA